MTQSPSQIHVLSFFNTYFINSKERWGKPQVALWSDFKSGLTWHLYFKLTYLWNISFYFVSSGLYKAVVIAIWKNNTSGFSWPSSFYHCKITSLSTQTKLNHKLVTCLSRGQHILIPESLIRQYCLSHWVLLQHINWNIHWNVLPCKHVVIRYTNL